jgi:hypothetical protein
MPTIINPFCTFFSAIFALHCDGSVRGCFTECTAQWRRCAGLP